MVAAIRALYQQLAALPIAEQPSAGHARAGSAAYRALETRIRALARRHWDLTDGGGPCGRIDGP